MTGPSLAEHLAGWTADQVAVLLQRRPDLVQPRPPGDRDELADRSQRPESLRAAIDRTTLAQNRILQLLVSCPSGSSATDLQGALPDGVAVDALEPTLAALEEAALIWRHAGRVHTSLELRRVMPTTLGPPLRDLAQAQTVDYLKHAIALLRRVGPDRALPPPPTGLAGRPPRKADLIDHLEALVGIQAVVEAVLAPAPAEVAELARTLGAGPPVIRVPTGLYFSIYTRSSYVSRQPAFWLFERGLLLPLPDHGVAAMPREVGVVLRGGRPVPDLALRCPALEAGRADPAGIDAAAGHRATQTLDRLADLLEHWALEPVKALKAGGLGVAAMKKLAVRLDTDLAEIARLVELAHLAGLLEIHTVTTTSKKRRDHRRDDYVRPSAAAGPWLERRTEVRWQQLATAWLRADRWPSASVGLGLGVSAATGTSTDVSPTQVPAPDIGPARATSTGVAATLGHQQARHAAVRRREVLAALAGLPSGAATTSQALAAWVYWQRPQPWLHTGAGSPSTAIAGVLAEAELLGVAASGALSSFGRALVDGDPDTARRAFEATVPGVVSVVTLQSDLTATATGPLDRDVLVELRLLADVESTGAATTFRFTEASLRRALDAGRDAESITAFLTAHAAKGLPQPLAYLVADVARRHGHLRVGTASSFVTSDDPATLADACSHRRTRKLGLRLVAPTVAISAQPPATVLAGLRAAGLFPTVDADDPAVVSVGPAPPPASATRRPSAGPRLPEPFRTRALHDQSTPLDAETARSLAGAIAATRR